MLDQNPVVDGVITGDVITADEQIALAEDTWDGPQE